LVFLALIWFILLCHLISWFLVASIQSFDPNKLKTNQTNKPIVENEQFKKRSRNLDSRLTKAINSFDRKINIIAGREGGEDRFIAFLGGGGGSRGHGAENSLRSP